MSHSERHIIKLDELESCVNHINELLKPHPMSCQIKNGKFIIKSNIEPTFDKEDPIYIEIICFKHYTLCAGERHAITTVLQNSTLMSLKSLIKLMEDENLMVQICGYISEYQKLINKKVSKLARKTRNEKENMGELKHNPIGIFSNVDKTDKNPYKVINVLIRQYNHSDYEKLSIGAFLSLKRLVENIADLINTFKPERGILDELKIYDFSYILNINLVSKDAIVDLTKTIIDINLKISNATILEYNDDCPYNSIEYCVNAYNRLDSEKLSKANINYLIFLKQTIDFMLEAHPELVSKFKLKQYDLTTYWDGFKYLHYTTD